MVLSRKLGERITIGERIEVVVVRIKGDSVRLGIEAPREIPVMRPEIKGRRRKPRAV